MEISKIKDQQAEGTQNKKFNQLLCAYFIEFKKQTEEKLQKKLELAKENRERVLQAKVDKVKVPIEKGFAIVQQNLAKLEEERRLLQEKIDQKLNTAEISKILFNFVDFYLFALFEDRQEHLDRLMERLDEHARKIEIIKSQTKIETFLINDEAM